MKPATKTTKPTEIIRNWVHIDVADKVLGRVATEIAAKLIGKEKPYFVSHLDCGDYVVVTNAKNIRITGKKADQKYYYRHSNYPGGFKETSYRQAMEKDPRQIIIHAVRGMLPKNKLQDRRLKRLKVYADDQHPYSDKFTPVNQ